MLHLAQIGGTVAEAVPRLADPPALAYYVLENPWPLTLGLGVCAVVALLVLRRRGRPREAWIALAVAAALGAVVAGLGLGVTTQREVLRSRTRELIALTATASTTDLRALLTERARIGVFMAYFGGVTGREEVLGAVSTYLGERYPLESHEIGPVQAVVDGPNLARTQVRVWVKPKEKQGYDLAVGGWFRIDWTHDGDGLWRASGITIMQIDGTGANPDLGR